MLLNSARFIKVLTIFSFSLVYASDVGHIEDIIRQCLAGQHQGRQIPSTSKVAALVRRFEGGGATSSSRTTSTAAETQTERPTVSEQATATDHPRSTEMHTQTEGVRTAEAGISTESPSLIDVFIQTEGPSVSEKETMIECVVPEGSGGWVSIPVLNSVLGYMINLVKSNQASAQILFDNFQFFFKLTSASTIEFRDALKHYFNTNNLNLLHNEIKTIEDKFIFILDNVLHQYGYKPEGNEELNAYIKGLVELIVNIKNSWKSSDELRRILNNIKTVENRIYAISPSHLFEDIVDTKNRISLRLGSGSQLSTSSFEMLERRDLTDRDIDDLIQELTQVLRNPVNSNEFVIITLAKIIYILKIRNIKQLYTILADTVNRRIIELSEGPSTNE